LDAGFNLATAAVVIGSVLAVWMAMDRSGLSAISRDVVSLVSAQMLLMARQVAPSLALYAWAAALIASALAIWWWAERDARI
jgi:hypothetical protein